MKLLVINGIPKDDLYKGYEEAFENLLDTYSYHNIIYFKLRDMNINYCTGCWDCWLKSPGLCVIEDDQQDILKYAAHVDHMVIVSPIILGYESSLTKVFKDRFIPTVQPFIRIHKGEQHHYSRYKSMPKLSFIGIEDQYTTLEDRNLMNETYMRVALNFDSKLVNFHTSKDIGGVSDVFMRF